MKFAFFVLCALLLFALVSGTYVFVLACVRRKDLPWLVEKEIKKTSYGKYYECIVASDRWLQDHNAKDVYINSADGLQLHALWVPAENAKGTILLAHGYRSTFLVEFCVAFAFYHERGMNLLIPDQRSHGKSQGRFITFGVKESSDMRRWIDFHNANLSDKPMVLNGISMGASTMLYLADKKLPGNVRGIIADCGFTSPKEIIIEVFRKVVHLPAVPTIWVADLLSRIFAGFGLSDADTRKCLAKSRLPVLMIHGKEDGFVPCAMSESAFEACVSPKELLLIDGADHGLSFVVEPRRYMAAVEHFLDKYI